MSRGADLNPSDTSGTSSPWRQAHQCRLSTANWASVRASPGSGARRDFDFCDIDTFRHVRPDAYTQYDWSLYGTVINCGAYTAVDKSHRDPRGRVTARKVPQGPALLARTCAGRDHARARVVRLRLRRHGRGPRRGGPSALCPSTARPRPPATSPWPGAPRHYYHALQLGIGEGHNFVKTRRGCPTASPTPTTISRRSRSSTTS